MSVALYTVQAFGRDDAALAEARFVREGFHWPAFVFAWAWLLYHRLWLAFLVWLVVEGAFGVLVLPHVSWVTALLVDGLARLYLGLEAARLRVGKGAGRALVCDVVEAADRAAAEAVFFTRVGASDVAR